MSNKENKVFKCPEIMDLSQVEYLVDAWQREGVPAVLDCSAIEKITTPGLQLLLSVLTVSEDAKQPSVVGGDTAALVESAALMGIDWLAIVNREES